MQYLVFFLLFAQCLFVPKGSYVHNAWHLAYFTLPIVLAIIVKQRFGFVAGIFAFWIFESGASIIGNPYAWHWLDSASGLAANQAVLYATVSILFYLVIFLHLKSKHYEAIENSLGILCLLNSITTIFTEGKGFFSNESMNGVMIAVTYPFLNVKKSNAPYLHRFNSFTLPFFMRDLICVMLPIYAIFTTDVATVPMVTMLVVIYFTLGFAFKKHILKITALVFALVFVLIRLKPNFLHDQGRFIIWEKGMDWWVQNVPPMNGLGIGTTYEFLPYIQKISGLDVSQWFVWFHNEWIQILFEQGAIGLFLALCLYFQALYCSVKKDYLFISLVGFGFASIFNFTLHAPFHSFLGAFLLARALKK